MLLRRLALTAAAGVTAILLVPPTAASAAPSDQDTAFLRAAHQSNLAEIAGGRIAQEKGTSQQVKDLGARFVADHTELDSALQETASALDVDLPSSPNEDQQALAARYEAASGADFDALFVATQMDAHMKAMALGRTEIAEGSDAQAKKVAQDAAPVIAAHHDLLEAAASDVGVPSRVDSGTGGLAAQRTVSPMAIALVTLGALLLATATLLLRRRRTRVG
jgi:putative membrane protein